MPEIFSPADFMEVEAEELFSPADFMETEGQGPGESTRVPSVAQVNETPGTIGGIINAAKRGWHSGEQGSALVDLIDLEKRGPTVRQQRIASEQAFSDPNYQRTQNREEVDRQIAEMLSTDQPFHLVPPGGHPVPPGPTSKAEQLYGPGAKLEQMMVQREAEKDFLRNEVAAREKKIKQLPAAEAVQAFNQSEGWEAAKAFAANPFEITANLIAESTAQSSGVIGKSIVGGLVAGPVGTGVAGAQGAYQVEYAAKIVDSMREAEIDLSDPAAVMVALQDRKTVDRWETAARRRGVPIAALTLVGGTLAGRFMGQSAGKGVGRVAGASGKELAEQSGLEAAGELSAQVASGEAISPKEIFAEAIASGGQNVAEVGVNVARERALQGAMAEIDPKAPLVEGVDYSANMDPAARPSDLAGAAINPAQKPLTQAEIADIQRQIQENQIPEKKEPKAQKPVIEPQKPLFTPEDFLGPPLPLAPDIRDVPLTEAEQSAVQAEMDEINEVKSAEEPVPQPEISTPEPLPADALAPPAAEATASRVPARRPRRPSQDRPPDILDAVLDYGKINLESARQIQQRFRPQGAARQAFTGTGGSGVDEVLDMLRRDGRLPQDATEDTLLDMLQEVGPARRSFRGQESRINQQIKETVQQEQEFRRALTKPAENKEEISASELFEGDEFMVQGHKVRVRELVWDENAELSAVVLEDGRRFGVQRVDAQEVLKVDEGTLSQRVPSTDFLPPGETTPAPAPVRQPEPAQQPEGPIRTNNQRLNELQATSAKRPLTPVERAEVRDLESALGQEVLIDSSPIRTPEEVQAEQQRQAQSDELTARQNKRLTAGQLETQQGMFDEPGQQDIFSSGSGSRSTSPEGDRPEGGAAEHVSFSVSQAAGPGVSKEQVVRMVERVARKWSAAPAVQVVQFEAELPLSYRMNARAKGFEGRIEGVTGESGTVWLVVNNLPSMDRTREVLAHEVLGHFGMEAVLGGRYDAFMLSVFNRYQGRELLKKVISDYGDAATDQAKVEVGSEIVARVAEGEIQDDALWRRVMDNIRRFFQELFNVGAVDKEIRDLLKQAHARVAPGRRTRFSISTKPGPPKDAKPYVKGKLARTLTRLVKGHRGVLPAAWRDIPLHGLHQRKAVEENIQILAGDLRKAVNAGFHDKAARDAVGDRILAFLEGQSAPASIGNPNVARAAVALRAYIDTLSTIIVKGGMVSPARGLTLMDNMGTWLRRSYLAFDLGMNWNYDELSRRRGKDKEIDRIWTQAEAHLRSAHPKADDGEIEAFMRKLVDREELESAFTGFLSGQEAASDRVGMNLSSMMRRKEIPVQLREWMGEVRDPYYKVMESGKWMAQFIARFETQKQMAQIGLKLGLLSKKMTGRYMAELYPNPPADLVQKKVQKLDPSTGTPMVDANGDPVMEPATTPDGDVIAEYQSKIDRRYTPLHGLWTTPQLKEALENEFEGIHGQAVSWINALGTGYLRYVGLVKANLVGWNPYSWGVNIAGGFIMNLANGRVNPFVYKRAWDTVRHGSDSVDGPLSAKQMRARMDRAMAAGAGVLNAGFFQEDLRNTLDREPEPHIFRRGVEGIRKILHDRKDKRGYRQLSNALWDLVQKPGDIAIQAPDNFQRVAAFLDELELSRRAYPGRTQEQHILWAADRASNTYQTYDRLLPGLREMSRIGLLNTFVSFKLELMRNIFWTARYATQDLRSSNRQLQIHGARRAAGLLAVMAAPYFVSQMAKSLHDIDDDDEEAIRTFLPPWDQADTLLFLGKDGTKYKYSAMSYLLPHVEAFRVAQAGVDTVTAEDPGRTLNQMLKGIVSDYFGPGAALGPILEATMKDNVSRKEGVEGAAERVEHWWDATLSPRLVRPLVDIWKGMRGEKGEWGKQYDIEDPLLKLATVRVRSYDVADQTLYKMRDFSQRWRTAASNKTFTRRKYGAGSEGAKEGAAYAKEKKVDIQKEYRVMVKHARQLGVSGRQISAMEKDLRIPLDLRD